MLHLIKTEIALKISSTNEFINSITKIQKKEFNTNLFFKRN